MKKKHSKQLSGEKLIFKLWLFLLVLLPNIGNSQVFTGGAGDGFSQDCLLEPVGSAISITCPTNIIIPCQNGTGTIVSWADATAMTTCTSIGEGCPNNLTGYTHLGELNGSSYFLSAGIEKWVDAQAMAVTAGGHLVVINDASEQAFLESTNFTGIAYTGLYDPDENGNYEWVNGDPLSYTNWDANQPGGGSSHYVAMSSWADYEWEALNFWTKKNFIVELPCAGGSTPTISQISGPSSGSLIPGGTTATIVYSATDNCGNHIPCSFTVTVEDCSACTPGTPCDDGNANTENDVITLDSCACAGTPISGCNIAYMVNGNDITVTGLNAAHVSMKIFDVDNGWSTIFNCFDNCSNSQTVTLPVGTYYLNIKLWNASWQTTCTLLEYFIITGSPDGGCDNINTAGSIGYDESEVGGYDPAPIISVSSPTGGSGTLEYIWLSALSGCPASINDSIPGTSSAAYDPGPITQTTYFIRCARRVGCVTWLESNCIVKGVTDGGDPACNISIVSGSGIGSVTINGLNGVHIDVKVFDGSWSNIFSCFDNCNNPETINNLPVGIYYLNIKMWNSAWEEICSYQEYFTVTGSALNQAHESDYLFFLANKNGRVVNLNWTTNTEYKNAYFIIERSADSVSFNAINEVLSLYEGYGDRSYQLEDDFPLSGDNYYRVKELFTDGTYRYSEIRKVHFDLDLKELVVFPNPAARELFINLKGYTGHGADIKINNSLGVLMDQRSFDELPEQPIRFDVRNYASGVYMVSIVLENRKRKTSLFVVSKL